MIILVEQCKMCVPYLIHEMHPRSGHDLNVKTLVGSSRILGGHCTLNVFLRFPAWASQYPRVLSAEQVTMFGLLGDQCNSRIACWAFRVRQAVMFNTMYLVSPISTWRCFSWRHTRPMKQLFAASETPIWLKHCSTVAVNMQGTCKDRRVQCLQKGTEITD